MATSPHDSEGLDRVRHLLNGEEPARRVGKYRIVREVGRGGMGVVYEALDPDLGRRVALKTLNEAATSPKFVELLRREAAMAAKLKHPNIVPVHEVGSVPDENGKLVHFIAMDFVEGVTLAEQMSRMARRKRIEVLEVLAGAVAFAHDQGVVHRDLKPQNVLLEQTTQGGGGLGWRVYLTDFGLAKQMSGEDLTRSGTVMGTPQYMAPEQVRGQMRRMGPWTDVWSLGVMLYEMIARKSPFEGPNAPAVYEKIVNDDPKPPRKVERAVHPDLETICMKALEKEPEKRYPAAAGFAGDLERYLRDEPIAARPVGTATRAWRSVRRRPAVWTLGSIAVLALSVAGSGWVRSVRKERSLEDARRREVARAEDLYRRREEALQRLSMHWWTITERKRELRQLRVPMDRGRRALEEAVRAVDAHVREWPDDPQGFYVRAQGRMWLGDLVGAEEDVRCALDKAPNFDRGRLLLGTVKVQLYQRSFSGRGGAILNRVDKAAPLLGEALEEFRRAEVGSAGAELSRTREDQVMERVARALLSYHQERRAEEAVQGLEEGVREYKAEEYAFWLAMLSPSGADSIRWYSEAIAWAPGYAAAYLHRALVKESLRDATGAIADLGSAIELSGSDASPYYERGRLKQAAKDIDGALADYDRAIALDEDYVSAVLNRGTVRFSTGNIGGARSDYERAVRLDVQCAEAWYNLGIVEHLHGDPVLALADYDRAISIRKDYPDPYCNRAMLKRAMGDRAGAIADFESALSAAPPGWSGRSDAERLLDAARRGP